MRHQGVRRKEHSAVRFPRQGSCEPHDLTKLLTPAGLAQIFKDEFRGNPAPEVRWGVVKDWSEQSRYETHSRKKANDIIDAVGHPQGILACIRKYW